MIADAYTALTVLSVLVLAAGSFGLAWALLRLLELHPDAACVIAFAAAAIVASVYWLAHTHTI